MDTLLFFDMEFTGLYQNTTPVSIGIVDVNGNSFYGEFEDYDRTQVEPWLEENVMPYLFMSNPHMTLDADEVVIGSKSEVTEALKEWLEPYARLKLWGDTKDYDVVLLHELFGGALNIPPNLYYISFDIATWMEVLGVDPDISREEFIGNSVKGFKHNSLYDARVIKACYDKLKAMSERVMNVNDLRDRV